MTNEYTLTLTWDELILLERLTRVRERPRDFTEDEFRVVLRDTRRKINDGLHAISEASRKKKDPTDV